MKTKVLLVLMTIILITFSSCKKEPEKIKILSVTPSSMKVSKDAEMFNVIVKSNVSWTVKSNKDWCIPGITSGENNSNLNINVEANTTTNERIAIVEISGADVNNGTVSVIQDAVSITVTSPTSSSIWEPEQTYNIQWDDYISDNVKIELYNGTSLSYTITNNTESNGSYSWSIPNSINAGSYYKIKITSVLDNSLSDYSDYFTITVYSGTVTDYDGNTYQTMQIGSQVWMIENLKTTHYPNGDAIPNVTDNTAWGNLDDNNTDDAYCFNNNDNTTDYGALYTYAAAIGDDWTRDNTINQGVCPDGWHLPTNAEWSTLIDYLGGESVAGGKMKETGTVHWNNPNTGATNESGFTAFSGGDRLHSIGQFVSPGNYGFFWSATQYNSNSAYIRRLYYDTSDIQGDGYYKSYGFSVRCLRD